MEKIYIIKVYQEYGSLEKEELEKMLNDEFFETHFELFETNEVGIAINPKQ